MRTERSHPNAEPFTCVTRIGMKHEISLARQNEMPNIAGKFRFRLPAHYATILDLQWEICPVLRIAVQSDQPEVLP